MSMTKDPADGPAEESGAGAERSPAVGRVEYVPASFGDVVRGFIKRVRSGESGMVPVLVGLVIIVVIFQVANNKFLTSGNLVNLFVQCALYIMLGVAEVFVLLLGEIDLATGYVAGVAAAFMAGLILKGWPTAVAIIVGLVVGGAIGLIHGLLITRLRLPSFVVTLAGQLGWLGVLLIVIPAFAGAQAGGSIGVPDQNFINYLTTKSIPPVWGWVAAIVVIVAYAAVLLRRYQNRRSNGLVAEPISVIVLKIALVAVCGGVLVALCNVKRGFQGSQTGSPWIIVLILAIIVVLSFLMTRTRFGRYVYAIGGNAEAARRAGINLTKIRLLSFMLTGIISAVAGLIYTSTQGSIGTNIPGGQYVLFAVAAAVIGGTSLFGGRGKIVHALLGGVVIGVINNGMGLLSLSDSSKDIVTALVLLAAVIVDAVSRRGRTTG